MKRTVSLVCALLAAVALSPAVRAGDAPPNAPAAPGPWTLGEVLSLTVSQSTFSNNWAGGDHGSIVWVLGSASSAERQFTARFNSKSTLQLAYGQTSRQVDDPAHPGQRTWVAPDKTTDQVLLESVGRFTLDTYVDPYFALRAETQFQDRSSPLGVLNFNPVRLKETAGIARVIVKTDDRETITRLGFGFRQVMGRTLLSASPRVTTNASSNDGGFEWQTNVKQPILQKKVLYTAALLLFQPLFFSLSGPLEQLDRDAQAAAIPHEAVADRWKATNVNFQNTFAAQITKGISVNLYAEFEYTKLDGALKLDPTQPAPVRLAEVDQKTRKAGQFKETLALGFSYRLF